MNILGRQKIGESRNGKHRLAYPYNRIFLQWSCNRASPPGQLIYAVGEHIYQATLLAQIEIVCPGEFLSFTSLFGSLYSPLSSLTLKTKELNDDLLIERSCQLPLSSQKIQRGKKKKDHQARKLLVTYQHSFLW